LQMQTTSVAEPVTFHSMGGGVDGSLGGLCGGFNTAGIFHHNFGLQSGARISRTNHFFYFQETSLQEYGNTLIYYLKADRLAFPLQWVYDQEIPAGSKAKHPKSMRFFGGPVFSLALDQKTRLVKSQGVTSASGVLHTAYSDAVTIPQWLYGVEAGLTVNSIFIDQLSLGVVFQYNLTPAAKVNFESQTSYQSATAHVDVQNSGSFKVIGSSFMLQIGVKPFLLKKE